MAKQEDLKQSEAAQPKRNSAFAKAKYLRISPRKVRPVIDTVRHKPVHQAERILMTLPKKAARMAEKVLKSAVANAKVLGLDETKLYVSDIRADAGPTMKRFMERSQGRADRILKRMAHISVTVTEGDRVFRDPFAAAGESEKTERGKTAKKKTMKSKKAASAGAKS